MREMEPGIYTNYFQVQISDLNESNVVYADVKEVGTARDIRLQTEAHIIQLGPTLFGYGPHSDSLSGLGFSKATPDILENPVLVSRMIVDVPVLCIFKSPPFVCWLIIVSSLTSCSGRLPTN